MGKRTARARVTSLSVVMLAVVAISSWPLAPTLALPETSGTGPRVPSAPRPSSRSVAGTTTAAVPSTYLGLDYDRGPARLVVVKTATGQVVRQLVPSKPGGGASFPSSSPSGPLVVYEQGLGTCGAQIDQVNVRSLLRRRAVAQPGGVADSNPSLSPDGRFVAFMRTRCSTRSPELASTLDIARTQGDVVSVSRAGYYPASTQAWGPNSRAVLALTARPARAPVLHVVTVGPGSRIVRNRALAPPAGCEFGSALFSPKATIIADMSCGERTSLVELSPLTGRVLTTLVAAEGGRTMFLGPVDKSGNAIMYGTAPLTSRAQFEATEPAPFEAIRWYVLSGGRSARLDVPSRVTPAAW